METEMKVVSFNFEEKTFKYKFPSIENIDVIDEMIREHFEFPKEIRYKLFDVKDGAAISISSIKYLANDSTISIKLHNLDSRPIHPSSDTQLSNSTNAPDVQWWQKVS